MSSSYARQAGEYARVGVESGVLSANPHRMVLMLFDGALRALRDASRHLAEHRIAAKGEAISRALTIIDHGLLKSLDLARGGIIAAHLSDLYDYAKRRLLLASLHNDGAGIEEVEKLLDSLRETWAAIGDEVILPRPAYTSAAA